MRVMLPIATSQNNINYIKMYFRTIVILPYSEWSLEARDATLRRAHPSHFVSVCHLVGAEPPTRIRRGSYSKG